MAAARGRCKDPDCTVAETGKCLKHGDPKDCPDFTPEEDSQTTAAGSGSEAATEPEHQQIYRFHSGQALGTQDLLELTMGRYCHLIGVLGEQDVGKTCLLLSLYLMASHGYLKPEYAFAGSLTLGGFEDRARRLRKWTAGLPGRLADHTSLEDPRTPSLLHLALKGGGELGDRYDLLLTDLPGEWTKNLIDKARTASRFELLQRADGIVLVVDGTALAGNEQRHLVLHRGKLALERLLHDVGLDKRIPLVLFISKCDKLGGDVPAAASELAQHALDLGFTPKVLAGASFSSVPDEVPNGLGVLDTVKSVLVPPVGAAYPTVVVPAASAARVFQRCGSHIDERS